MTVKPEVGKPLYPQYVVYPDGHRPEHFDIALCGTCGEYAECMDKNVQEVTDTLEIEMVKSLVCLLEE